MARGRSVEGDETADQAGFKQRLDKWLWFARIVRTRVAACEVAESGHVRINGQRVVSAARPVRRGDVLTVALDHRVLVLKVVDAGERRGGYSEARHLYEDLTTPPDP